jgi:4-amino-4-deoxy-L-arabinose transferase-like glycosyltransferase
MFLLVVLPWHVIESVHFGGSFWHVYLWYHVVARFSQGIESNGGPWWYYFTIFTQMPYGILALVGLAYGACASWRKNYQVQLLFVSAAVVFVTFSLARTKGSGYVVIIYPYLSLLFAAVSVWALSFLPKFWQRLAVTVVLVVTFVLVGFSYNQYRLFKMNGAVYTDIRTIGQWISVHEPTARLHYVSLKTPMDIIAARPALVYYTNRFVDERGREEVDSLPKPRLRLATHLLYVRNGEVYVVAVRLVP